MTSDMGSSNQVANASDVCTYRKHGLAVSSFSPRKHCSHFDSTPPPPPPYTRHRLRTGPKQPLPILYELCRSTADMPFLDLPIELRFEVYGYIVIPDSAPLSAYRGLYQSCRQIKAEMDSECVKVFKAHLLEVAAGLPGVHIDLPTTFGTMQRLHLVVNLLEYGNFRPPEVCTLQSLLSLHLLSITISSESEREHDPGQDLDPGQDFEPWEDPHPDLVTSELFWRMHRFEPKLEIHSQQIMVESQVTSTNRARFWFGPVNAAGHLMIDRIPPGCFCWERAQQMCGRVNREESSASRVWSCQGACIKNGLV